MHVQILILLCSLLSCLLPSNGETYYVKPPNSTTPCPSEPCYKLSYYAQHNTFNTSNAKFVFLSGNHPLGTTVVVENVQNLTLTGDDRFETGLLDLSAPSCQIHCNRMNDTGFSFENTFNLTIEKILLLECVHVVDGIRPHLAFGALTMRNVFNTTISRVTIQKSPGYGIIAVNLFGQITESIFLFSNHTLAYFKYNNDYNCHRDNISDATFVIKSSQFLNGYGRDVGGLAFVVKRTCPGRILVDNVTAVGNAGFDGGHMNIYYYQVTPTSPSITISNSNFFNGHSQLYAGGGVNAIYFSYVSNSTHTFNTYCPLTLQNCLFKNNSAVYMSNVLVKYTSSNNEIAPFYLALFETCTFSDSVSQTTDVYESTPYGVIWLRNSKVTLHDCTFEDNVGTAIVLQDSIVTFENTNIFRNNSGTYGGALLFSPNSYMILQENTHLHFINNRAQYAGGAIYVDESECASVFPCFFQVPVYVPIVKTLNIKLHFRNNTATEHGGTALYGGLLGPCETVHNGTIQSNTAWEAFEAISSLHNSILEPSVISSDPNGVCFCTNNIPDCDKEWNVITIYPGQSFNITAVTVGQVNGTVSGAVYANIDNGTISSLQSVQILESYQNCTNLTYTVFSQSRHATLTVYVSDHTCNTLSFELSPKIHIALQECPTGFTLTAQSKCDCVPTLKKHHVSCDINKGTVRRPAKPWIGYYNATEDNETSGVLYYPHCPLDYCVTTDINILLNNSDDQCAFDHSGILCGSCKPGLSLALGTSKCLKCSNTHLTLLIPFVAAGLALVFLLVVCNLTVTEGTLNGLIFYANIMWVNKTIFFPSNHTNILTVFLAWINLDLGIQTCFYDGMDAYGKTWLQFVFPLYIWTIVVLLIYLSRYKTVNRLVGRNAVKVLATLFLLSYAKVQRTIITALSATFIQYPDDSTKYLWLHDGNVEYFTGKQIPLFMAGLAFLLFMSLPYTLALLLICYVRRIATPRYRLLRWIVRLLPLFDAYTAPYKPRYQFWTGFLLLVRLVLFLVFTLNLSNDPSLNLMAVVIASLFVLMLTWSFRAVYKQWPLDVLESTFILNLGIVSVIVLYTGVSQSTSDVAYASTGIAFATFVGIMFYHCYNQMSKIKSWRGFWSQFGADSNNGTTQRPAGSRDGGGEAEPLLPQTDFPEPSRAKRPRFVYYDPRHYRESMLEHLSDPRKKD